MEGDVALSLRISLYHVVGWTSLRHKHKDCHVYLAVKVKHNKGFPIICVFNFLFMFILYFRLVSFFVLSTVFCICSLYCYKDPTVYMTLYTCITNKLFFASLSLCCKHHYPINAFSRVLVKSIILTRLLKPQDVSPNYSGIKEQKCTLYLSLAKKTICPHRWD